MSNQVFHNIFYTNTTSLGVSIEPSIYSSKILEQKLRKAQNKQFEWSTQNDLQLQKEHAVEASKVFDSIIK